MIIRLLFSIIYTVGICFIATIPHELYHVYNCGGQWIAGTGYVNGQKFLGGISWCQVGRNNPGTELVAYAITFIVLALGFCIWVKMFKILTNK